MNNNEYDDGLEELLDTLRKHPEYIKEIVFHRHYIPTSLKSKAARKLARGVANVDDFLEYVRSSDGGHAVAQCFEQTKLLCAKGTGAGLQCVGGTGQPTK